MDKKQLSFGKSLPISEGKDQLDPIIEEQQALQKDIQSTEDLGKLERDVLEIKQRLQKMEQNRRLMLKNQEESKQRQQAILESQKKPKSFLAKMKSIFAFKK
ncbi:hypothetical protein MK805_00775 [Shimazuella sp. AN120528]|uniref:hypothetical protein n=1 Tax=Shimazuella soli TaxID=1892854 RepID=UPI001F0FE0E7|nr:hypothetical protein [Shimazuella soli]MCH5583504.1 hypothetical protein [Shimazuella soli]